MRLQSYVGQCTVCHPSGSASLVVPALFLLLLLLSLPKPPLNLSPLALVHAPRHWVAYSGYSPWLNSRRLRCHVHHAEHDPLRSPWQPSSSLRRRRRCRSRVPPARGSVDDTLPVVACLSPPSSGGAGRGYRCYCYRFCGGPRTLATPH